MRKYLKLILLIILIVILTSCGYASHRKLFNQLYNKNFDTAEEYANEELSKGKYSYYVFELSEISEGHEFDFVLNDKAIYRNEGIDRIILSSLEVDGEVSYCISVIEFETVEAAEAMISKKDLETIDFVRYENLVYYLDTFGFIFIYGYNVEKGPFYCSNDDLVIYAYNADYQGEIVVIPNSVKYIINYALQMLPNIKMIMCGENLEKIGACSFRKMENLEYFKANSQLKSIGRRAFSENPKLKTVILNEGLEYIDDRAFDECPSLEYVVIPASVIDIGYRAFSSGILYIEAESKPEKWDRSFYGGTAKVYWGNEWNYNEEGIPVLIK